MSYYRRFGRRFPQARYRDALQQGSEPAARLLERHAARLRTQGDTDALYHTLYELFTLYTLPGETTPTGSRRASAVLGELAQMEGPDVALGYYVAEAAFKRLGRPRVALRLVRQVIDRARGSADAVEQQWVVPALRLEVSILAQHAPRSPRLREVVAELHLRLTHPVRQVSDWTTLQRLVATDPGVFGLRTILEYDWAALKVRQEFQGAQHAGELQEIEALLRTLPAHTESGSNGRRADEDATRGDTPAA